MKELVNQAEIGNYRQSRSRTRRSRYEAESISLNSTSSFSESDLGLAVINSPPSRSQETLRAKSEPRLHAASSFGVKRQTLAVANNRGAGSQSNKEGKWLEHVPTLPLPSTTVFQPDMKKKKSVNKLVNIEDLTSKTSKYCLRTDVQDSEGEVETQLYKVHLLFFFYQGFIVFGWLLYIFEVVVCRLTIAFHYYLYNFQGDVLQTVTGGAQVIFNDVEILKQVSPTRMLSPTRKRGSHNDELLDREELKAKCKVGIGHQSPGKRFRQD